MNGQVIHLIYHSIIIRLIQSLSYYVIFIIKMKVIGIEKLMKTGFNTQLHLKLREHLADCPNKDSY